MAHESVLHWIIEHLNVSQEEKDEQHAAVTPPPPPEDDPDAHV